MQSHFWKIEDVRDVHAKNAYEKILQTLKNVLVFFTPLCILVAILFIIKGFMGQPVFEIYVPQWFPLYLSVFYQALTCFLTISLPVISTDLFIFTVFMLTSLQFKMLNEEIKNIFGGTDESKIDVETIKSRIRKCVNHHTFLQK